jgi:hypothetical protein
MLPKSNRVEPTSALDAEGRFMFHFISVDAVEPMMNLLHAAGATRANFPAHLQIKRYRQWEVHPGTLTFVPPSGMARQLYDAPAGARVNTNPFHISFPDPVTGEPMLFMDDKHMAASFHAEWVAKGSPRFDLKLVPGLDGRRFPPCNRQRVKIYHKDLGHVHGTLENFDKIKHNL